MNDVPRKLHVLILMRYYLPGFTAGGPIRSISNMVEVLGEDIQFSILTHHEDPRDPKPYESVQRNTFQPVGKAMVNYLTPETLSLKRIRHWINAVPADLLYVNSLVNPAFTLRPLWLRRTGQLRQQRMLLAPRGELNPGALLLKKHQKKLLIEGCKAVGCYKELAWQATNEQEKNLIATRFGAESTVYLTSNLPRRLEALPKNNHKVPGELSLVFLSRIARMKNLHLAIQMLTAVQARRVTLHVYGHREDAAYWLQCEEAIRALPPHVAVTYHGVVPPEQVPEILAQYDALLLPTRGENYGHAIVEALSVGTPVVISDRTPWRNLEAAQAGWDGPLEHTGALIEALNQLVQMDAEIHEQWRQGARRFIQQALRSDDAIKATQTMFYKAAGWDAVTRRPIEDASGTG